MFHTIYTTYNKHTETPPAESLHKTAVPETQPEVETEPIQYPISLDDKKIVCPVYTKSHPNFKKSLFKFEKVDWSLCTHVVSVAESEEGINKESLNLFSANYLLSGFGIMFSEETFLFRFFFQ